MCKISSPIALLLVFDYLLFGLEGGPEMFKLMVFFGENFDFVREMDLVEQFSQNN
jgi:hypothetical protein